MKRLIQSILKPFGLRLARLNITTVQPSYGLDVFFSVLKQFGFSPTHIIDVGANHGNWTRKAIQYFPDVAYTLVEPQADLKRHVQDLIDSGYKIQWIHAGAGDTPGILAFTISNRDDSSSFVPVNERKFSPADGSHQVSVEVRTLNDIVSKSGLPVPEMVKIDAEGFDLQVLCGASDLFGKTDIFLVEAVVCCVDYQNTLSKVVQFMSDAGYRLIDITNLNRSPKDNVLWLCEFAFLRNQSQLLNRVTSYE
jgi:FkbM family methyltransferase